MPRTTIADYAADLLAEHRALPGEELGRLIAAHGLTRAKDPARATSRALGADRRFHQLRDGRWAVPRLLLRGATLTHRLSAGEITADVLALTPDLAPITPAASDGLLLPDGRLLVTLWDDDARDATGMDTDAALQGPSGWLEGMTAGQLVEVRLTGDLLRVECASRPPASTRLAARRLVDAARTRLSEQAAASFLFLPPAVSLETLAIDLLVDDPVLFADPLPPIGEAFVAAGLEVHRGHVGLPGTDWDAVDEFMSFDETDLDDAELDDADDAEDIGSDGSELALDREMIEAFNLDQAEVEGLRIVLGAYDLGRRLGGIDSRETNASLARMLEWPGIARVLAVMAWSHPELEPFVAAIAAAAVGRDAAGPLFVLGTCAEARDDVAAAERLYQSALEADRGNQPALVAIARYETDRGNYAQALEHLRAALVPAGDSERSWLERNVKPAITKVGRNEPCPCGSGRKYKACHLDAPGENRSVEPSTALLHKLDAWLAQPNMQRAGDELLDAVGAGSPAALEGVDPMVADVVLHDRGGLRQFLAVRGMLLPEAERTLGTTWLLSRRTLYEVVSVLPGSAVTLRDLRSSEGTVEVLDRSISRHVQPLDLVCLRLMPDGAGGVVAIDGVLVPRPQRRHVLDLLNAGDSVALLRWMVTPPPKPRLTNTEGEPLQLMTVVYRLPDPTATAAALGRKLRAEGDHRFVELVVRHGQEWIRGSITLDGDRATIDANSVKRAARLERTLLRAAPGAGLIRREERGLEEAMAEELARGPAPEPVDVASNPELVQAMDELMRRAEANWVDEAVPALGGLTPRQAATHRRVRPELEALLDDMAWHQRQPGGAGLMDPTRIRILLGLRERSV